MRFILALYRWFITMLCFAYVFLGGALLSLTYFNYLKIRYKDVHTIHVKARHAIHIAFKILIQSAVFLRLFDLRFYEFDKINKDGGSLIIANHPTYIDYVILSSKIDNLNCIIKEDIASNIFLKNVIKTAGLIVNSATDESLLHIKEAIDKEQKIVIFPEGTRSDSKKSIRLKRGFAQVALRCPANMRIIYIDCAEHFLGKHSTWNKLFYTKPQYNFYVKDFFDKESLVNTYYNKNYALASRHLTKEVQTLLNSYAK